MRCYRKLVRIFKESFPEYKISVRRVKLSNITHGDCRLINGRKKRREFLIRINNSLSEDLAIDTLVHEVAHILSWGDSDGEHGSAWGVAYSAAYIIYLSRYVEATHRDEF